MQSEQRKHNKTKSAFYQVHLCVKSKIATLYLEMRRYLYWYDTIRILIKHAPTPTSDAMLPCYGHMK